MSPKFGTIYFWTAKVLCGQFSERPLECCKFFLPFNGKVGITLHNKNMSVKSNGKHYPVALYTLTIGS